MILIDCSDSETEERKRRSVVEKSSWFFSQSTQESGRIPVDAVIEELSMHWHVPEVDTCDSDNSTIEKISSGLFRRQLFKARNISKIPAIVGQFNTCYY